MSLGTGLTPVVDLKEIDVFRPDSIWATAKVAYGISTISKFLLLLSLCTAKPLFFGID